jgi:hypothetical protein
MIPSRIDVGAQRLGERVMARHAVLLTSFLMQADRPSGAARPEILDLHLQGRIDAREAVGEGGGQRAVSEIAQRGGPNGREQFAPFGALEHRCLAGLHHMFRPAHCMRRVVRHDLAGDQSVEQHPYRRELLL